MFGVWDDDRPQAAQAAQAAQAWPAWLLSRSASVGCRFRRLGTWGGGQETLDHVIDTSGPSLDLAQPISEQHLVLAAVDCLCASFRKI